MVPKICTYRRSGTHLIMATVYKNFEVGDQSKYCWVYDWKWAETGETELTIPWAKMFGTHAHYNKCKIRKDRILYGVRHPLDALVSYWRMPESPTKKQATCPLEEWITEDRIVSWVRHVNGYILKGQCFWVRYEDLIGDGSAFVSVVEGIGNRFDLKPKVDTWQRVTERVSWLPITPKPKNIPFHLIDRIKRTVPEDLMDLLGYEIKDSYNDYS